MCRNLEMETFNSYCKAYNKISQALKLRVSSLPVNGASLLRHSMTSKGNAQCSGESFAFRVSLKLDFVHHHLLDKLLNFSVPS